MFSYWRTNMAIFTSQDPNYTYLDLGFDRSLVKTAVLTGTEPEVVPELRNVFESGIAPAAVTAGQLLAEFEKKAGVLFNGKTGFNNTDTGYRLGVDETDGLIKIGRASCRERG